jgi:hypothetical protein
MELSERTSRRDRLVIAGKFFDGITELTEFFDRINKINTIFKNSPALPEGRLRPVRAFVPLPAFR